MLEYVQKALVRFGTTTVRGVNSPMPYVPPNYGAKSQTLKPDSTGQTPVTTTQILYVQEAFDVFL